MNPLRKKNHLILSSSIFSALLLFTSVGYAQYGGQPVRYSRRPLTLPSATLRIDANLQLVSLRVFNNEHREYFFLNGGVAAGFTDDLEIGALLMPIRIAPDARYMAPGFYGMFRLLRGPVEVGLHASVVLPVDEDFQFTGGVPVIIRLADIVRLNTGAFLGFLFANETVAAFSLPLQVAIQASDEFFIGPELGLCAGSTGRNSYSPQVADTCWGSPAHTFKDVYAPLGVFGGYTIDAGTGTPITDLRFGFRLFDLAQGFDGWMLYAGANFYIYL